MTQKPEMTVTEEMLRTKRNGACYGQKAMIGDTPAAWIKSRKKGDFLTLEELARDLYGDRVERVEVIFK